MTNDSKQTFATGKVKAGYGNLLDVEFTGEIKQGEVAFVELSGMKLKAEVIEVKSPIAKVQVFEDTKGVKLGTPVRFTGSLLEAELGPGLLASIVDGLQNPLQKVADCSGYFLPRGVYLPPLDREKKWDFEPSVKPGDRVERGDILGRTHEGRFPHPIVVPFACLKKVTIDWVISSGAYTVDTVVAKGKDPSGNIIEFTMVQKWPIKVPLSYGEKIKPTKILDCGLRTIDTQFPIAKGGTFCTPGPFGAGKTVIQHHLAKYSSVDIVVVVACGERAGEVVEILREFPHLMDPHTGESLMTRTVIICNTSSMPVAARESSIYMGVTIAEYYRQMGLDVLLLADSTSRWAQALREMSGRLEEIPGEEAFPAYLSSRIAEFYERSGVLRLKGGRVGSVTIGGAVSPAGGNFEEPVTQATLAVVGAFLGLSRKRSDARRYPAIDPLDSWTKYLQLASMEMEASLPGWGEKVEKAEKFLFEGDEIGKRMEVVGEEGTSIQDMMIFLKAELYDFCYLQQNAFDKEDCYCEKKRQIALFLLMDQILDYHFHFSGHDKARAFFNRLQTAVKNINYLPFESESYGEARAKIEEIIEEGRGI